MADFPPVTIRRTETSDLPSVLAIINREIREGVAHFGTEDQTIQDIEAEFEARGRLPWLVADDNGTIAGFARAGRWKQRLAYSWTVEVSVYLEPAYHRRGIGKSLYQHLFHELEGLGYRRVIAGMTMPNKASQKLHESMGMRLVGEFERQGFKNGRWHNVRYYQLDLPGDGDLDAPPRQPGR